MNVWRTTIAVAFTGLLISSGHGRAQDSSALERQSVLQKPRPDYDPLGVRVGSFLVYPAIDLSETYDSNVFVTQTDTKSDLLTTVRPSVQVRSDWNNHALNFTAADEINRYATQVGENNSNLLAATDGRLDIERNIYLTGRLSYQFLHESRTSPNTVTAEKSPIGYQLASGALGFVHETGRLGLRVDGTVDDYSYNDGITSTGEIIPETNRNRVEYAVSPRLSYGIIPGYEAFVKTRVNWRDYLSPGDAPMDVNRSSHGYEVAAGTAVRLGPTLNGEIFAGYFRQTYGGGLPDASGPDFGGNLLWNVTALTSVRGSVARTVEETILAGVSTFIQTATTITVEHELLRDVLVSGGGSYIVQDFQGISRSDRNYEAHAGARYLINRNLNAGLNISWMQRNSTAPGNDYDRYLLSANLRLQF